jgi:hypothetical protein
MALIHHQLTGKTMSYTMAPETIVKLGKMYSWLIHQPREFANSIGSVAEVEQAYDNYTHEQNSKSPIAHTHTRPAHGVQGPAMARPAHVAQHVVMPVKPPMPTRINRIGMSPMVRPSAEATEATDSPVVLTPPKMPPMAAAAPKPVAEPAAATVPPTPSQEAATAAAEATATPTVETASEPKPKRVRPSRAKGTQKPGGMIRVASAEEDGAPSPDADR